MRIMRASTFPPDSLEPITVVMRECDVSMPFEEIAADEFGFTYTDIFEVDGEPGIYEATLAAANRVSEEEMHDEKNMAVMYYWLWAQFRTLNKGGIIFSDKPAPLTVEQIHYVHRQLRRLPDYDGYTFMTFDKDGTSVTTSPEEQIP
jgi:hypothetical protein